MGFCSEDEYERFLKLTPLFEQQLVEHGIILIKYFFDVSQDVQEKRFLASAQDRRKHWKLSPMAATNGTQTDAEYRNIAHQLAQAQYQEQHHDRLGQEKLVQAGQHMSDPVISVFVVGYGHIDFAPGKVMS
jgi:hypothetical protein